jgi:hypothetical protein
MCPDVKNVSELLKDSLSADSQPDDIRFNSGIDEEYD